MPNRDTWLAYLVPARIAVGYHFLVRGSWPKLVEGFGAEELTQELLGGAARNPIPIHRDFIINFVVPNAEAFSRLIAFGELAIGLALITGCLVRVASSFAAFQNLNIYLAIAIPNASAQVGFNRTLIVMHVIFVAASAGRCLGIDGLLKKKFPRSPIF